MGRDTEDSLDRHSAERRARKGYGPAMTLGIDVFNGGSGRASKTLARSGYFTVSM